MRSQRSCNAIAASPDSRLCLQNMAETLSFEKEGNIYKTVPRGITGSPACDLSLRGMATVILGKSYKNNNGKSSFSPQPSKFCNYKFPKSYPKHQVNLQVELLTSASKMQPKISVPEETFEHGKSSFSPHPPDMAKTILQERFFTTRHIQLLSSASKKWQR